MATRATIALQNDDGTFSSIYSHWDGYPSYVGRILYEHYKTLPEVQKLIEDGDVSSFEPDGTPNHYKTSISSAVTSGSYMDLMLEFLNSGTDYLYVYSDYGWEYVASQDLHTLRRPLVNAIGEPVEI